MKCKLCNIGIDERETYCEPCKQHNELMDKIHSKKRERKKKVD